EAIQPHSGREATHSVETNRAVAKTATKSRSGGNGRRTSTPSTKSLSEFITERFDEFSRSQKDVARYIGDHLDEGGFQTAEELARRANTSSSTVVRFSQALGFEGYPELQQAAIDEYRRRSPDGKGPAQPVGFHTPQFGRSL